MDPTRLDRLSRTLATLGPRRGILGVLAALPLGAILATLHGEHPAVTAAKKNRNDNHGSSHRRQRRKARHHAGDGKKHRKDKRKRKHKRPGCTPTTCTAQGTTCGSIPDGCGETLDCGPCTCATGCHPVCQTCNSATGHCDPIANDTPCEDGDACTQTDTCQRGVCEGRNPVVCPTPDQCHDPGVCHPATGLCSNPSKADGTRCGNACTEACTNGTCGPSTPMACATGERCSQGACVCDATSGLCCLPDTANLQEAVNAAASGATLTLCAGTWTLSSTVGITRNLTLVGAGAEATTLDGNNAVRVLSIQGTAVTLRDLTIRNGSASEGGGIYATGTLTLQSGSHVTGNAASEGGGIYLRGALTLQSGSSVTGNAAVDGGGIFNYNGGITLKAGSSVTGNTAGRGGGVHNRDASLTMEAGSSVTDNAADDSGGGIFHDGGIVDLKKDSSVTGNTAPTGGGIYSDGDGSSMTHVLIDWPDIVVNNCQDNCAGTTPMFICTTTPVSCPG